MDDVVVQCAPAQYNKHFELKKLKISLVKQLCKDTNNYTLCA